MTTPYQFLSLANGLPKTRAELSTLAFYAYHQFLSDGGTVKVCRPAFAVGCEMRPIVMQAMRAERRK